MVATTVEKIVNSKVIDKQVIGRKLIQVKTHLITTAATAEQADTYTFDLATLGGTTLLGLYTNVHTTLNSVLAANAITTTVAGTVITFTIPAAGGTKSRATKIYYE